MGVPMVKLLLHPHPSMSSMAMLVEPGTCDIDVTGEWVGTEGRSHVGMTSNSNAGEQ